MRTPLLAGNWKMFKTVREALNLVEDLLKATADIFDRDMVVCPPFTALHPVGRLLEGKRIRLGGQNLFWENEGAYTGEVSALMLKDASCDYVIIGHSERRKYFGETNAGVNRKVHKALEIGLIPIVCVGETLDEREAGLTEGVVRSQVVEGVAGLTPSQGAKLVVAYEPVWAIGTGKTDTPEEADRTIGMIRRELGDIFGYSEAESVRILYGGSVKPDNIDAFMARPQIDGALVGGASLKAESFIRIIRYQ
jgi:triosephosphate isomerase